MKLKPKEKVVGNKWWNAKKGEGVVLERLKINRVLVKWDKEPEPCAEYLVDLNKRL